MPILYTAGHSTRTLDSLLALLDDAGVRMLADVRRFPASRRHPRHNRCALEAELPLGIGYRWLGESLGGRRKARLPIEERSSRRTWDRSRYPIPRVAVRLAFRYAGNMVAPLDHCQGMPQRIYERGEDLLQEGKPGSLFILAEGAVEILKGDFRINVVDEAGSIFGEVSVLLGIPPMATVRALERSRVFVAEDGLAFLSSRTDLALAVARLLARRLNSLTTYLADLKKQFEDQQSHLGIVDEVLETLVHDQSAAEDITPGSDREPDPNADPT